MRRFPSRSHTPAHRRRGSARVRVERRAAPCRTLPLKFAGHLEERLVEKAIFGHLIASTNRSLIAIIKIVPRELREVEDPRSSSLSGPASARLEGRPRQRGRLGTTVPGEVRAGVVGESLNCTKGSGPSRTPWRCSRTCRARRRSSRPWPTRGADRAARSSRPRAWCLRCGCRARPAARGSSGSSGGSRRTRRRRGGSTRAP